MSSLLGNWRDLGQWFNAMYGELASVFTISLRPLAELSWNVFYRQLDGMECVL